MIKFFQKTVLVLTTLVIASFTVNAQLISEHFSANDFSTEHGYAPGQSPATITNATIGTNCDPAGGTTPDPTQLGFTPGTVSLVSQGVTYTLVNAANTPTCMHKGHGGANVCETNAEVVHGSAGYVHITSSGSLTTSGFVNPTSVTVVISTTGSGDRLSALQTSTDGTTFTNLKIMSPIADHNNSACGQYGLSYTIPVTTTGTVYFRIVPNNSGTTAPANALNTIRVHDFSVTASALAGIKNSTWAQSGLAVTVDNDKLTVTSDNVAGSVDIVTLTGVSVGQKEIQKGGEASFSVKTGLYLVRVISNGQVYSKKVVVN